jgi:hypothetical protein
LALKAESIRIDRIPGKSTVGIEAPNAQREKITLREPIESARFQQSGSKLTIALGKTINGEEYIADLAKMPHLLIAGATGAGKSVTLNAIICSILYKASPEEVKFIMVDPKRVELGLYEGIPHLLTPIVTDPKRASNALKWAVNEMEARYRQLATLGVRNIEQFNRQVREMTPPTLFDDPAEPLKPLPYIVIAIGACGPDDDRAKRGRDFNRSTRPNGARGRNSPDTRHSAAVGRHHHRRYQSKHPMPQARLPAKPRSNRSPISSESRPSPTTTRKSLSANRRRRRLKASRVNRMNCSTKRWRLSPIWDVHRLRSFSVGYPSDTAARRRFWI